MFNSLFKRFAPMAVTSLALVTATVVHAAQPSTATSASPASTALKACYQTCAKKHKDATAYEGCMIECKKTNALANPAGGATKR